MSSQHKAPLAAFVVVSIACVVVVVNALRSDASFITGIFRQPKQVVVAGARLVPAPHEVLAAEADVVTGAAVGLDAAPDVLDRATTRQRSARRTDARHHRSAHAGLVVSATAVQAAVPAAAVAPVPVVPAAVVPAAHHRGTHHSFGVAPVKHAAPQPEPAPHPAAAPGRGPAAGPAPGARGHRGHGHLRPMAAAASAGSPAATANDHRGASRAGHPEWSAGGWSADGHHGWH